MASLKAAGTDAWVGVGAFWASFLLRKLSENIVVGPRGKGEQQRTRLSTYTGVPFLDLTSEGVEVRVPRAAPPEEKVWGLQIVAD
jgi:hypothetical protein